METIKTKGLKINYDGTGNINYQGKNIVVKNILEQEVALIDITEKKGNYTAEVNRLLSTSNERIIPECSFFLQCGGCQYLHISYENEIKLKEEYLNNLFKDSNILPFVRMDDCYHYRNKSQMTYKLSKTKKVVCGFYEEKTHKIVSVSDCKIQSKEGNIVINALNEILTKNKITPYDEASKKGIIRHIVLRYAFKTGELMVSIVTNGEFFPGRNNVVKDLLKKNLGITTIVQNYNDRDTSVVLGQKQRVIYGPGFIYDELNDLKFKISSQSFYQINPKGTAVLYQRALELTKIKKTDTVVDTYAGIGTIGLFASRMALEVISVELNKEAYKDGITNAKINKINNVQFVNMDSTLFIKKCQKGKIDIVILDPPREGTTKEFIEAVGVLAPRKVLYISCEPKTLLRDINLFKKENYFLKTLEGFDMFPRTFNIECVAILERR